MMAPWSTFVHDAVAVDVFVADDEATTEVRESWRVGIKPPAAMGLKLAPREQPCTLGAFACQAGMDYRKERVYLNKHRVKQLTVVGKACEAFWYLAFHKRRGMSALLWSDVKTVELQHVVVKGRQKRSSMA